MKKGFVYLGQALLIGNLAASLSLLGYRLTAEPAPGEMAPPRSIPSSPLPVGQPAPVSTIAAREASKHLLAQDAMFVDSRSLADFKKASIPTSYSLPVDREPSEYDKKRLKERPLLIVYGSDPDSRALSEKLAQQGLKVALLQDGLDGWRAAGLPVTTAVEAAENQQSGQK